jgi:GTP-binding protein
MTFTVTIVGRPNVGKSTLFNRLVRRRLALVDDQPGVTRDRREGDARLGDLAFKVIDTAGLEDAERKTLSARMQAQTAEAMKQADAVLFVVDARDSTTPIDRAFADLVRRAAKPTIVVANKSESRAGQAGALESYALGLGDPVAVSAEHGEGMADLYDALRAVMPEQEPQNDAEEEPSAVLAEDKPIRIAVVGRPNTGKSTLINRLIGEDRLLTGPEAGITRDSIAVDLAWRGRQFRVHDTAGMRRRARIEEKLEKLSVADALNAIRFAEVVIVLIDSQTPFEEQDIRIADLVEREGRAIVIAVNKWGPGRA